MMRSQKVSSFAALSRMAAAAASDRDMCRTVIWTGNFMSFSFDRYLRRRPHGRRRRPSPDATSFLDENFVLILRKTPASLIYSIGTACASCEDKSPITSAPNAAAAHTDAGCRFLVSLCLFWFVSLFLFGSFFS